MVRHELIGVPAHLRVAGVGVDAAERARGDGGGDLVRARVTRERRVVALDVESEGILEAELAKETGGGGDVPVVLVFARLLGFGLDEKGTGAAGGGPVRARRAEERGVSRALGREVGGGEMRVALAAAPEVERLAAELASDVHRLLHLRAGADEDVHAG